MVSWMLDWHERINIARMSMNYISDMDSMLQCRNKMLRWMRSRLDTYD